MIWHNTYSYLKAKTLKYRLRVLEKKDETEIQKSSIMIEDLFTVNELSESEDRAYKALRSIYPDFIPIVKITRGNKAS